MDTNPAPVNRILRGVLDGVNPLVACVLSIPDDLEIHDLRDVFLAMLDWTMIRTLSSRFMRRSSTVSVAKIRQTVARLPARRQGKFLYICYAGSVRVRTARVGWDYISLPNADGLGPTCR